MESQPIKNVNITFDEKSRNFFGTEVKINGEKVGIRNHNIFTATIVKLFGGGIVTVKDSGNHTFHLNKGDFENWKHEKLISDPRESVKSLSQENDVNKILNAYFQDHEDTAGLLKSIMEFAASAKMAADNAFTKATHVDSKDAKFAHEAADSASALAEQANQALIYAHEYAEQGNHLGVDFMAFLAQEAATAAAIASEKINEN